MPWLSANLGDVLAGAKAKANAAIADAEKALSALTAQTNALKAKADSIVNAATANKSMLDEMAASGFYMITLDPQVGSWVDRLSTAANEPPNSGYCAGTANLIISADPATVTSAYAKLKEAMMKPIDDAKKFIDQTDFSDFIPEAPVLEDVPLVEAPDWDTAFTFNEWKSTSLGDVFGGAMSGAAEVSGQLNKAAKGVIATANHVGKLTSALNKGLNTAQSFMNDLAATGAYSIMLAPGAGGYLARLQGEVGAPPNDSGMYCAGFVCIAMAGGVEDLAAKYATIDKLMKG